MPTMAFEVSADEYSVTTRISGNTRVETSIEASKKFHADNSALTVVLAGYHGEVDALTGTLLASSMSAPLLLVDQFENIEAELLRLGARNIFLLGGETVISQTIEKDLQRAGYEVNRIDGANRLETAVAVANEAVGYTDHVFLTNDGRTGSLVDALAVGPVSGMYLSPILLTAQDTLPKETHNAMKQMGISMVTVVGGTGVVSQDVEDSLKADGFSVERIAGSNRWETAVNIADLYFSPGAAIMTNDGYTGTLADALMSGTIGAKMHMPLLLTGTNSLNDYTEKYLLKSPYLRYVLGGENVIAEETFKAIVKTEGETIRIDTEEQIQNAQYDYSYLDAIAKDKEMISEFAQNGKSITTYKSVEVQGKVIDDIRVHSKWVARPKNGLIYIGTGKDFIEEAETPFSYSDLFERSGWILSDFIMETGEIRGFSETGRDKAENELRGLVLVLPETDEDGQVIHTVGEEAFKDFYFQRAKMPHTIKAIQAGAFENMNLVYTEFPEQLETIGKKAFSGNSFTDRIDFSSLQSLSKIGEEAFNFAFFGDASYTIDLKPLSSLRSIGKGAFVGNRIQSVILPEGLISIGPDAFIFNAIQQVYLPATLVNLDKLAFDEDVLLLDPVDS